MNDPREALTAVRGEVAKAVAGHDDVVDGLLVALLVRGHVLLEGVPGVAKTLTVKALARSLGLGFTNFLLADEINRTPPKTQAALLEAMEERQVTVEGDSMTLPDPFLVVATQNPIEFEGTYPLPEAQLDR